MRRVVEQGDTRPMRDNKRAMEDLRAILESREALYARADFTVETSGRTVDQTLGELLALDPVGAPAV
jgi:XRE family aerobic/anaerobic benzoate catabolism transcriptional regulator